MINVEIIPSTQREILCNIDYLIDSPFIFRKKKLNVEYAGSENQRRIDLRNIHTIEELGSINDWNELDCEVK